MLDVLDYGFAWIAVFLAAVLAVVYITSKIAQGDTKKGKASGLNRALRKPHIVLGILCISTGLIHGLASSDTVWSLNVGTVSWVLSILLGINFLIRKRLKAAGGWMVYHRIITVFFLASIVWHIVDVGGVRVFDKISGTRLVSQAEYEKENTGDTSGSASPSESTASASEPDESASAQASQFRFDGVTLKDGVYNGTADAYGPGLTVQVKVENGRVTNVAVVSHNEDKPRYYQYPMEVIPEEIVEGQTLDVDLVSGATATSAGIVNAVIDALTPAVTDGQLPDPLPLPYHRRK